MRFLPFILLALIAIGVSSPAYAQEENQEIFAYSYDGKLLAPIERDMLLGGIRKGEEGLRALLSGNWQIAYNNCSSALRIVDHLGIPDDDVMFRFRADMRKCIGDAMFMGGNKAQACNYYYPSIFYNSILLKNPVESCKLWERESNKADWLDFSITWKNFNGNLVNSLNMEPNSPQRKNAIATLKANCEAMRQHGAYRAKFKIAMAATWFCHGVTSAESGNFESACSNWQLASKNLAIAHQNLPAAVNEAQYVSLASEIDGSLSAFREICKNSASPF